MDGIAQTPPMGWNSWDSYGASVREEEVLQNAQAMAERLKPFGWEYVVVDIQWSDPEAADSQYRPYARLEMDGYGRLLPAEKRFPSAAGGRGFGPLAERVHALGLQFGVHMMRGVPRQAVYARCPVLGTLLSCADIAHTNDNCAWNTDMYGVDALRPGAQAYYDSLFALYASWGVDFVKVDDIASPYHAAEIELIRNAISRCGREMVLSLSCGPAPVERAAHLSKHANMWRTTGDYWDSWEDLYHQFSVCHAWEGVAGPGHWPDADMLPLGHLAVRSTERGWGERMTRFSRDEQLTMMTLWCMVRSPLMMGGLLTDLDEWTLSLLTNREVLRLLSHSHGARQAWREERYNYAGEAILWTAKDEDGGAYAALFNCGPKARPLSVPLSMLDLPEGKYAVRDLWAGEDLPSADRTLPLAVPSHGARLVKLRRIEEE